MYWMSPRQLRAPAIDGGLLVDPPADRLPAILADNLARLATWNHDFQGRTASRLRDQVRREVLALAHTYLDRHGFARPQVSSVASGEPAVPLVVTGHQPELFHPGVWIKNFAAGGIAAQHHGLALNLIVDNDLPKSASIRVPNVENGLVRTAQIDFDRWSGETPFEDLRVQEEDLFGTFALRVRRLMGDVVREPLLDDFWPRVLARRGETASLGERFSLARREVEASWGLANLEVPLSSVCQTDGFSWFVCHLLAHLPRYVQIHNQALAEYRLAHGIRSKNHPVAALATQGDWLEAPFWVWRRASPRRRGLLARLRGREIDLRIAGENEVLVELPLGPDREACCAVERLRDLAAQSVRLRTRALTTTLFSRFLLGDMFIHGIGGSKYDELGDEIARRFLGIEPPAFLTVSLTQRLGLPEDRTAADPAELLRLVRALHHNPDRYLLEPYPDELRILIRHKQELIAAPVSTHRERKNRCRAIRACNLAMQPWVRASEADLLEQKRSADLLGRSNRTARSRDFAYVLHSAEKLTRSFDLGVSSILAPAATASSPPVKQPPWGGPSAGTTVPFWHGE
jgi:hypothetical protein